MHDNNPSVLEQLSQFDSRRYLLTWVIWIKNELRLGANCRMVREHILNELSNKSVFNETVTQMASNTGLDSDLHIHASDSSNIRLVKRVLNSLRQAELSLSRLDDVNIQEGQSAINIVMSAVPILYKSVHQIFDAVNDINKSDFIQGIIGDRIDGLTAKSSILLGRLNQYRAAMDQSYQTLCLKKDETVTLGVINSDKFTASSNSNVATLLSSIPECLRLINEALNSELARKDTSKDSLLIENYNEIIKRLDSIDYSSGYVANTSGIVSVLKTLITAISESHQLTHHANPAIASVLQNFQTELMPSLISEVCALEESLLLKRNVLLAPTMTTINTINSVLSQSLSSSSKLERESGSIIDGVRTVNRFIGAHIENKKTDLKERYSETNDELIYDRLHDVLKMDEKKYFDDYTKANKVHLATTRFFAILSKNDTVLSGINTGGEISKLSPEDKLELSMLYQYVRPHMLREFGNEIDEYLLISLSPNLEDTYKLIRQHVPEESLDIISNYCSMIRSYDISNKSQLPKMPQIKNMKIPIETICLYIDNLSSEDVSQLKIKIDSKEQIAEQYPLMRILQMAGNFIQHTSKISTMVADQGRVLKRTQQDLVDATGKLLQQDTRIRSLYKDYEQIFLNQLDTIAQSVEIPKLVKYKSVDEYASYLFDTLEEQVSEKPHNDNETKGMRKKINKALLEISGTLLTYKKAIKRISLNETQVQGAQLFSDIQNLRQSMMSLDQMVKLKDHSSDSLFAAISPLQAMDHLKFDNYRSLLNYKDDPLTDEQFHDAMMLKGEIEEKMTTLEEKVQLEIEQDFLTEYKYIDINNFRNENFKVDSDHTIFRRLSNLNLSRKMNDFIEKKFKPFVTENVIDPVALEIIGHKKTYETLYESDPISANYQRALLAFEQIRDGLQSVEQYKHYESAQTIDVKSYFVIKVIYSLFSSINSGLIHLNEIKSSPGVSNIVSAAKELLHPLNGLPFIQSNLLDAPQEEQVQQDIVSRWQHQLSIVESVQRGVIPMIENTTTPKAIIEPPVLKVENHSEITITDLMSMDLATQMAIVESLPADKIVDLLFALPVHLGSKQIGNRENVELALSTIKNITDNKVTAVSDKTSLLKLKNGLNEIILCMIDVKNISVERFNEAVDTMTQGLSHLSDITQIELGLKPRSDVTNLFNTVSDILYKCIENTKGIDRGTVLILQSKINIHEKREQYLKNEIMKYNEEDLASDVALINRAYSQLEETHDFISEEEKITFLRSYELLQPYLYQIDMLYDIDLYTRELQTREDFQLKKLDLIESRLKINQLIDSKLRGNEIKSKICQSMINEISQLNTANKEKAYAGKMQYIEREINRKLAGINPANTAAGAIIGAEKQKVIARAVKKAREESLLAPNNIEDITHNVVKESNVEIGKLFELNRKYNGLAKKITASRMPSNHLVMNQYNAVIDTLNNELGNNNSTDELELSIEHVKKKLDEHSYSDLSYKCEMLLYIDLLKERVNVFCQTLDQSNKEDINDLQKLMSKLDSWAVSINSSKKLATIFPELLGEMNIILNSKTTNLEYIGLMIRRMIEIIAEWFSHTKSSDKTRDELLSSLKNIREKDIGPDKTLQEKRRDIFLTHKKYVKKLSKRPDYLPVKRRP